MGSEQSVVSEKQKARQRAKSHRDTLHREYAAAAGLDIEAAIAFLRKLGDEHSGPIAGYWPIASEFDTRDLLTRLNGEGCICCLPVVTGPAEPLMFRKWTPDTELQTGAFNVAVPSADAEPITPRIVLTPLLAFDDRGYRLGYGGGFYDRTLSELRRSGDIFAVGMAYSGQHEDKLPTDKYDQPLNAVITECYSRVFT